jgi:hypothetical protein
MSIWLTVDTAAGLGILISCHITLLGDIPMIATHISIGTDFEEPF